MIYLLLSSVHTYVAHSHMNTHTHSYSYTCTHARTAYSHTCTCTCTHMHIHTHTCTHLLSSSVAWYHSRGSCGQWLELRVSQKYHRGPGHDDSPQNTCPTWTLGLTDQCPQTHSPVQHNPPNYREKTTTHNNLEHILYRSTKFYCQ